MDDRILEAVVDAIEHPEHSHGGFVTYLVVKDYARAAFQADSQNLAAMGEYIKWREWLIITTKSDGIVVHDQTGNLDRIRQGAENASASA